MTDKLIENIMNLIQKNASLCNVFTKIAKRVCVCVCVCVCGHVYVVYEDTNLYNDMGMT